MKNKAELLVFSKRLILNFIFGDMHNSHWLVLLAQYVKVKLDMLKIFSLKHLGNSLKQWHSFAFEIILDRPTVLSLSGSTKKKIDNDYDK